MDEAKGRGALAIWQETHQPVDHAACNATRDPDVAVDDPDELAFGFAVGAADVADFGVGT